MKHNNIFFALKVGLVLLKRSMKKAIRKNHSITVGEFLASKKDPGAFGAIGILLAVVVLVAFILFVSLFQD